MANFLRQEYTGEPQAKIYGMPKWVKFEEYVKLEEGESPMKITSRFL